MANTELARLIALSSLHEEDVREITRIFEVLTPERQIQILRDWDTIISRIRASREKLEEEKTILLQKTLDNIERDIEAYEKSLHTAA